MAIDLEHQEAAEVLVSMLPLLNRLVSTRLRQAVTDETSLSQMRVLRELSDKSITLSELAERRFVTRQAASLQVQGLVEKGWVRRIPHATDRRQAILQITDEGLAHWLEARHALVDYFADLFEQLTPDEFGAVREALPALSDILTHSRDRQQLAAQGAPS
jgi:DNA-binding MarR family transcriptional regulator